MTNIDTILQAAHERQRSSELPYAGAVTPGEAYAWLSADSQVLLIDVRTQAERDWVGRVSIPEAQHAAVQWSLYPGGAVNPHFMQQLVQVARPEQTLLLLCRSGVRSRFAAELATTQGYAHCYDILEGFEGDRDAHGHRKQLAGWCKAQLPWIGA
jgi:rhodanese-related sulfurtransferase